MKEFRNYICNILEMDNVTIKSVSKKKLKELSKCEHTLAAYDLENKCIYYLKKKEYDLTDYYLMAHEIRHAWQDEINPDFYFKEYYENMEETEYHNNDAEIDANAFACIAIAIAFNKIVKRTYNTMPVIQKKYEERIKELSKQYGIEFN